MPFLNEQILVGERRLLTISYRNWLDGCRGETLTLVTVTVIPISSPATAATVDTVALSPNKESVSFIVGNGAVNDQFTVELVATTTLTQTRIDTITVNVLAVG